MMRAVLLFATLGLLASPALGQDRPRAVRPPADLKDATVQRWLKANVESGDFVFAVHNEKGVYLLEPAVNQVPSRSPRRLWLRQELFATSADGVRSALMLYEFDCAEQRSRRLTMDTFGDLNLARPLKSGDADVESGAEWSHARPETMAEEILRQACALQHSRLVRPMSGGAP